MLISEIDKCFECDPHINEVDHLKDAFLEAYSGKKVKVFLESHKLAIAFGGFKEICTQAMEVIKAYREKVKAYINYSVVFAEDKTLLYPFLKTINEKFVKLPETQKNPPAIVINQEELEMVNSAARALLLINGEHYTALNVRREIFLLSQLKGFPVESILSELEFISLINMKFRKSTVSWAYRKELFRLYRKYSKISLESTIKVPAGGFFDENVLTFSNGSVEELVRSEMCFLNKVLMREPRNYSVHEYRIYLFYESISKDEKLIMEEYEHIKSLLCCTNVRDTGNYHYLFTHLIPAIKSSQIPHHDEILADTKEWIENLMKMHSLSFVKDYLDKLPFVSFNH